MNKSIFIILILLLVTILPIPGVSAESGPPPMQEVEATGQGINADEAFKQAVVDAVRQVVGTLVSAENVISNDKLIKDEVLTLSNGFVEQVIKQEKSKTVDGAWNVKLRCVVRKGQVYDVLQKANVPTTKVDGISLFATAVSQSAFKKDSRKVVSKAVRDFFRVYPSVYKYDLQKPELVRGDDKMATVKIKYSGMVDMDLYCGKVLSPLQLALKSVSRTESRFNEYNYKAFSKLEESGITVITVKDCFGWSLFGIESEILKGLDLKLAFALSDRGYRPRPRFVHSDYGSTFLIFYNSKTAAPVFVSAIKRQINLPDIENVYNEVVAAEIEKGMKDGTVEIKIPTDLLPSITKMTMHRGLNITSFFKKDRDGSWSEFFDDAGKPFYFDGWFVHWDFRRKLIVRKGVPSTEDYVGEVFYIGETID